MKLRSVMLAATMLALPVTAWTAEPITGLYIGGGIGFDYLNSVNAKSVSFATPVFGVTRSVRG